jgi:hypothetical protein
MKTFGLLMALSAGMAFAGSEVVVVKQQTTVCSPCCAPAPRIPQPIMQGIKDLAVRRNPNFPKCQLDEIEAGVTAYLALQRIPDNPGKRAAAEEYPFDFPKQLYLAQRPLQN